MDTFEVDAIKIEKQKAMQRYRTFQKIANVVRTLEFFAVIMLISLSSSYLPAAINFSSEFLRRFSSLVLSPHFVFVVGNVIIITLFAKSSADRTSSDDAEERESPPENNIAVSLSVTSTAPAEIAVVPKTKVYRRTKSAVEEMKAVKDLRRLETVPCRKIGNGESDPAAARRRMHDVYELSNEEFRRKVEAFIEKQQRFLREESMSVVLSSNNRCHSL